MALFQPTNITPSTFSGPGAGTIDVNNDLTVSWQVNGNSPMLAYQIVFMQNDIDSTQLYSTGKVTLSQPFYGVDYNGNVQYFSVSIESATLTGAGMVNGYADGYKMQITQWWSADDSIEQTSASFFITRATPTITIDTLPDPFNTKAYTFSATYSQADGDAIEWERWEIALQGASADLYDTGKIYGAGELKTDYDGFFSGNTYQVMCTIQTVNGVEVSTGWQSFACEYQTALFDGETSVSAMCYTDAVQITFPDDVFIMGEATGDYTLSTDIYGESILTLPTSSDSVTWSKTNSSSLLIEQPYAIAMSGQMPVTIAGENTLLQFGTSANDTFRLTVSSSGFKLYKNNQQIASMDISVYGGQQYSFILQPLKQNYFSVNIGSYTTPPLFPSDTLYPSATTYPSAGIADKQFQEFYNESGYSFGNIISISIFGPSITNYLWVEGNGGFTAEQADGILDNYTYSPTYDENTRLLATFNGSLSAGSLDTTEEITGISIYRQDNNAAVLKHIADLPVGTQSFRDYSVASQNTYKYYVYASTESSYALSSIETENITPLFWNYTLMCCSKDDNGVYHVENEYRFALDVSTGAVSNNNKPTLLDNFTRYPLRQPINTNYRSGTLTALIGRSSNNKYVDSVDLMQELYALSTSTLTKFLKTRKGEIMLVETSAPISQQVGDKYAVQPSKISLPWAEVGTMQNVSIISEKADAFWNAVDDTADCGE